MARKNGERIGRKAANSCAMRAVETFRGTSLGERETCRDTSHIKKQNISKLVSLVSIITLKRANDLFTIIMVYFFSKTCLWHVVICSSSLRHPQSWGWNGVFRKEKYMTYVGKDARGELLAKRSLLCACAIAAFVSFG